MFVLLNLNPKVRLSNNAFLWLINQIRDMTYYSLLDKTHTSLPGLQFSTRKMQAFFPYYQKKFKSLLSNSQFEKKLQKFNENEVKSSKIISIHFLPFIQAIFFKKLLKFFECHDFLNSKFIKLAMSYSYSFPPVHFVS